MIIPNEGFSIPFPYDHSQKKYDKNIEANIISVYFIKWIMLNVQKRDLVKLVTSIAVCLVIGSIGYIFTVESIQTWYPTIEKPAFAPPDSVLVPVWTILFVLMGIAAFLVWRQGLKRRGVTIALVIFSAQLIINVIWSVVFFGLRSSHYGMLVILALWVMILLSLIMFFKISRESGLFMLPYFIWVSYAAILNVAIWALQFS